VKTALVSDLHLGQVHGADLLRRPEIREVLFAALQDVDRLVLLGDAVEMREGPVLPALTTARPFFEELGHAMAGRQVVLIPGNHDHRLAARWLERRRTLEPPPLGVAERAAPAEASEAAAMLDEWLGDGVELELAYPGLWVRDDVYATHGHYLDRHVTIPGFEPLAVKLCERMLRRGAAEPPAGPDGYEVVLGPVYGLLHEWAQSSHSGTARGAGASQRVYRMLTSDDRGRSLRGRFVGGLAYPAAVAAINAVGLGPARADLSGPELRRAGLLAMGETLRRLDIAAAHVLFGHTHRPGPLPRDDAAQWRQGGASLTNTGSWVYESFYVGRDAERSPYWPGCMALVGDSGAPELRRLLIDRGPEELRTS
jgi:calcineurin-like phosphoesterase family protein